MSRPANQTGGYGCTACGAAGLPGYCARRRCYCAHAECWAADSYRAPDEHVAVAKISGKKNHLKPAPASVESANWIDKY